MADLIENCRRRRGMIGLLTVLGALLLGARAQQQEFGLVGSDVTLVPKYTGDLKEIKWTLNGRIFVEIVLKPQEETVFDLLNDRTTINKTNGALTIRYLTIGDSGVYSAQVILMDDSFQVTEIRLTVHDCPDQPIISVESTEDQFVVSCESFSTDVTYEWFNPTTSVSKNRSYAKPKKNGTLTCVVDNEMCNKRSSINFYTPDQPEEKSVGGKVILVPQYTGDPSEIIWKVNGYKLVEMVLKPRVDIIFYRLQDRATISETDGSLIIRELTREDYGVYTAVVLVNNDYYYTERRLPVHEYSPLSGGIIALIVIGGLCLIIISILLWYCCCRKSGGPSEVFFIDESRRLSGVFFIDESGDLSGVFFIDESEGCITVKFCNDDISPIDESHGLLEDHSKRIQSPRLTIHGVQPEDHGKFTAEAVMSDGKEGTFTKETETSVGIQFEKDVKTLYAPNTKNVKKMVWKKDGVTMFEWAVSSLKFHASNIKLERESVTVNNAEGKESYKVKFQLEEPPESTSIRIITFHPIKMTGKDPITWKKDGQLLNIGGDRIKCDPDGDLTIYNATSEDKGKYTVQCIDNELDQEFILQF